MRTSARTIYAIDLLGSNPVLLVICIAFTAAALTLFSGFGLGSLLLPAFALSFPLEIAVAATAVVHLANNLFKALLLGKHADWGVVLRFALPGAFAALVGALLLERLSGLPPLAVWWFGGAPRAITPVGAVIGLLVIAFAAFELHPRAGELAFPRYLLPVGGVVSGFLGGLSGHQGALRTAFLLRCNLSREAFLGTGIVSAICIDCVRLAVYGASFFGEQFARLDGVWGQVLAGILAAFCGSFFGSRLVKKVTMRTIQRIVGVMLGLLGCALALGLVANY